MEKHIAFIEASTSGAGAVTNRIAKEMGCYVTLFTRGPESYKPDVLKNVDQVIVCETNDAGVLAEKVKEVSNNRRIDGITTTADFYVPQASKAAQEMGLPSLTYEAASEVRNKYKMRLNLQKFCPELNPPFRLVETFEEALGTAKEWGYPFIAKPQDGNDSLDVKLIKTESELADYMRLSKTWDTNAAGQPFAKGVLLEGYIDGLLDNGREPSIETMQPKGGKLQLIGTTQKVLAGQDRGHFAELGSCFSERIGQTDVMFEAVSKALTRLDIDCGVIHTELRFQNGRPKILEINPRLIGDKAGSHVIELALGRSPVRSLIEIAFGEAEPWEKGFDKGAAILGISMRRPGRFLGLENMDELKQLPGVVYVEMNAEVGGHFGLPSSNRDVLAQVITKADTPDEALSLAKNAVERARIITGD
ncbi:MAG: ATP-grasp domain-containing protein [Blastocatellia bacterium]